MRHAHAMFGCSLALALLVTADVAFAPPADRSYGGGHVALEISGDWQFLQSVDGGNPVALVTAARSGDGRTSDKRVTGVTYEDITVTFPAASFPPAIRDALDGKNPRLSGNLEFADFSYKAQRRLTFHDAVVAAVRFPALDGASKETAVVQVVLSPTTTKESSSSGNIQGAVNAKQKKALANAFRVHLNGAPVDRAIALSAIEVRSKPMESASGAERIPTKHAGESEIPNFKLTVPASEVKIWQDWLDQTLKEPGSAQEKTMRVELLDPTLKNAVLALDLSGVGIVAVRMKQAEAGSEAAARAEIELYAEGLKIAGGDGGAAPPADGKKTADTASPPPPEHSPTAPGVPPIRRPRTR